VLEWRFDPQLAIEAVADFAKDNLRRLGVAADGAADQVGRAAYLAHHLGLAGARRYLGHGLGEMQAGLLLAAQIGADAANRAVAEAGSAVTAHRRWLEAFVGRKIVQPLAELPPSGAEGFMRRTSG
jgi:hypothetical protein